MATRELIILGIDPGTLVTGFGVIRKRGSSLALIEAGAIKNSSTDSMPLRLRRIYTELCAVIGKHHPDEFAIETAFYSKNVQSALKIGQARGVAILSGVLSEIPVSEYSPREVKKAVVGSGAASKEQVQYMVMKLLQIKTAPRHLDITDALAVAICHANRIAQPRQGFRDWASYLEAHPEKILSSTKSSMKKSHE